MLIKTKYLIAAMMVGTLGSDAIAACGTTVWIGGAGSTARSATYQSVASVGQAIAGNQISNSKTSMYAGFIQAGSNLRNRANRPAQAAELPTDINSSRTYPNPFRPSLGHSLMRVANLPANVEVKIYTYAGELVRELTTDSQGEIRWDARNRDGDPVASGIYFGFIKYGASRQTLKLAIQR